MRSDLASTEPVTLGIGVNGPIYYASLHLGNDTFGPLVSTLDGCLS
jgi:hypothetical protein